MTFIEIFNPTLFMLAMIRLSGAIIINPIFGRRNVPSIVKAGLTALLAFILIDNLDPSYANSDSIFGFIFLVISEFAIGYSISLIMNMFLSAINSACEVMDVQIGLSMSKIYDPGSNVSSPLTGSIFYLFLILIFFITNGHLTFYRILVDSFDLIPCGSSINLRSIGYTAANVMSGSLSLALKFALPLISVEFVTEMGLGVLSRAVPSINVFSIGIQMRIITGLLVLVLLTPAFGSFCDMLFKTMNNSIFIIFNTIK